MATDWPPWTARLGGDNARSAAVVPGSPKSLPWTAPPQVRVMARNGIGAEQNKRIAR